MVVSACSGDTARPASAGLAGDGSPGPDGRATTIGTVMAASEAALTPERARPQPPGGQGAVGPPSGVQGSLNPGGVGRCSDAPHVCPRGDLNPRPPQRGLAPQASASAIPPLGHHRA